MFDFNARLSTLALTTGILDLSVPAMFFIPIHRTATILPLPPCPRSYASRPPRADASRAVARALLGNPEQGSPLPLFNGANMQPDERVSTTQESKIQLEPFLSHVGGGRIETPK